MAVAFVMFALALAVFSRCLWTSPAPRMEGRMLLSGGILTLVGIVFVTIDLLEFV